MGLPSYLTRRIAALPPYNLLRLAPAFARTFFTLLPRLPAAITRRCYRMLLRFR
jgi:hypothetical protein